MDYGLYEVRWSELWEKSFDVPHYKSSQRKGLALIFLNDLIFCESWCVHLFLIEEGVWRQGEDTFIKVSLSVPLRQRAH